MGALLLLAAWMRFGYVGVHSFAFDEARLSLISLRMARGDEFASVGMPSSAGVPNMPAAAWIFAIPYSLSASPQVATWFVSLLSMLAVAGVWWLARQWGERAGIVAALFMALHPYAVLYGRSIWAQNLLIPLAVALLLAVYAGRSRNRVAVGMAVFLSGFAFQVHFAGAALALVGIYAFFRFQWWRSPMPVVIGAVLAVIFALPFLFAPGAVRGLLATAGGERQIDLIAWQTLLPLTLGSDWSYLLHGEAQLPLMRVNATVITGGLGAVLVLLVGMLGVFGAASLSGIEADLPVDEQKTGVIRQNKLIPYLLELALLLIVAPLLFFTAHSTPVFIHYLLPIVPGMALFVAWLCHGGQHPVVRNGVMVVVVVLAIGWAGQLFRAFPFAATNHTPNGMATPLGVLQRAANSVPSDRPLLYFTHGDNPDLEGEPAIFSSLWWPRGDETRIIDGRTVLILPPYPATIMFTERPFQAWEEMRESELLLNPVEIPRRETIEPFHLTTYDGETPPVGFTLLEAPVDFAHGGTLLGWRTYTIGPRTRISTLWQATTPIGENVQQFHHLRTSETLEDEPLAVSDVSVRGHLWQDGDTVIVMADFFDLQSDTPYTIDVGQYTLPDVTRIPFEGGDVVRLGVFTLE
ncbi:MAG: hypothetical protein AAF653_05060 [Chloroflexota bacterium]